MSAQSPEYKLLGVLQQLCPTSKNQEAATRIYNHMKEDGMSRTYISTTLASMILDGLRYKNWPM